MHTVTLDFVDPTHIDRLFNDASFLSRTSSLNPRRNGGRSIIVTDPVPMHTGLDSEIVVLSIFAQEIIRVIFPNSEENIRLLNADMTQRKGGLVLGTQQIIDSTTVG